MSGAFRAIGIPHHVIHRRSANARMSCHALCVEAQIHLALWGWMLMRVRRIERGCSCPRAASGAYAQKRTPLQARIPPSHVPPLQAQLLARALPCLPLARDVRHNYRSCLGKSPKQLRFHIYMWFCNVSRAEAYARHPDVRCAPRHMRALSARLCRRRDRPWLCRS